MSLFHRLTLGVAGVSATGIGLAIALAPHSFYASYGVAIGEDPTLLSELRAPGATLATLGTVIFAGAVRPAMARLSAALGAAVFWAYAVGRSVSLVLDGAPDSGIVIALLIECAIGGLCLLAFARRSGSKGVEAGRAAAV